MLRRLFRQPRHRHLYLQQIAFLTGHPHQGERYVRILCRENISILSDLNAVILNSSAL